MPRFGTTSRKRLETADEQLQVLFKEVVKYRDCKILEGHRSREKQDAAYNATPQRSKVRWPNSKHNQSPAQAVDVAPYPIDWNDKDRFIEFAGFVMGVASQMHISIRWGGNFKSFFDGPHFEIKK